MIDDVIGFFHEQGINIVTIQPEFSNSDTHCADDQSPEAVIGAGNNNSCLVTCLQTACKPKHCCVPDDTVKKAAVQTSKDSIKDDTDSKDNVELEEIVLNSANLTQSVSFKSFQDLNAKTDSSERVKKKSTASLPSAAVVHSKYQKAVSAIENAKIQSAEDNRRYRSDSVISRDCTKNIMVENNLQQQTDTTDNNETENLYNSCCDDKH